MIPVDEALEVILSLTPRLGVEEVPLDESPGRVLAHDVASDIDMPPFHRAAMDGFAVRSEDVQAAPVALVLAGVVQAGQLPPRAVVAGEAVGIMTGAPVPPGADAVVPVEQSRSLGHDRVEIRSPARTGQHIARQGSEIRVGDLVLRAGTLVDPSVVAVLATVGSVKVSVGSKPRVGLLVTGDELVEAGEKPPPGCIRNSNGPALAALIRLVGGEVISLGTVRDRAEDLEGAIARGLETDALVTSGGVSEGLFDLVEPALERMGVKFHFTKVAVKPGAPFAFGSRGETLVFALPGNPVSAQVTFDLFVRPSLRRMQGATDAVALSLMATLGAPLTNTSRRQAYVPVRLECHSGQIVAWPLASKGSADAVTHARANALVILDSERREAATGDRVPLFALESLLERRGESQQSVAKAFSPIVAEAK